MGDERTVVDEQRVGGHLWRHAVRVLARPKNRAKGPWTGMTPLDLIRAARVELDEAEAALKTPCNRVEIEAEFGDAAAFIGMALDVLSRADCCCYGAAHEDACCPGYFRNAETNEIERCDECKRFESDDAAVAHLEANNILVPFHVE
jgi:hypothetical protein